MAEQQGTMPHKLIIDQRKRLQVTGVGEVLSFQEDAVVMKTSLGTLIVQGRGLKLRTLAPAGGQVEIDGTIDAAVYQEHRDRGGWVRRLLK